MFCVLCLLILFLLIPSLDCFVFCVYCFVSCCVFKAATGACPISAARKLCVALLSLLSLLLGAGWDEKLHRQEGEQREAQRETNVAQKGKGGVDLAGEDRPTQRPLWSLAAADLITRAHNFYLQALSVLGLLCLVNGFNF